MRIEYFVNSSQIAGYNGIITRIVGREGPPGVDGELEFFFNKTTPEPLITELQAGDYILVNNTISELVLKL